MSETLQSSLLLAIHEHDTATFVFATVKEGDGWGDRDSNLHVHGRMSRAAQQKDQEPCRV